MTQNATGAGLPDSDPTFIDPADDVLISDPKLQKRWDCSIMFIPRLEQTDPDMPPALLRGGRKFRRLSQILAYERLMEERAKTHERPELKARLEAARAARGKPKAEPKIADQIGAESDGAVA